MMFWRIGLIAFMTAVLAFPSAAPAQEARDVRVATPIPKIDVDFPGGTIIQMLDQIEKTNGITPNVVVAKNAADLILPPIKLKSVTIAEAIQAIGILREIGDYQIQVQPGRNIQTIIAYPKQPMLTRGAPPPRRYSKVYDIKDMLGPEYGIDDIVTAVKTAWEMISEDHTGDLKYHVETKLLIAVGNGDELETVQDVLLTLQRAKVGEKYSKSEAKQVEMQDQMAKLMATLKDLQSEINAMKKRLNALAAGKTDF
jgi:hypothetical protein